MLITYSPTEAIAESNTPSIQALYQAANKGDPWAQLNLGAAYDHGLASATPNPQKAIAWYRKAAEQGLAKAQFNVAHCLATGHGTKQDYAEARIWMHRAAQQNMPAAQFLLGVMLTEGLGGLSNQNSGLKWLKKAAQNHHQDAVEYLRNLP